MAARGRHAAARLAGDDQHTHRGRAQIDIFLGGDLRQPDGVGRRAAEHGGGCLDNGAQACGAAHAAAGYGECTHAGGGVEPHPESQEWPEGEGEENAIPRANHGCLIYARPVAHHPVPALSRIQPAHGCAGSGGAGLAEARITIERVSEVRAVGRMRGLIVNQLLLKCVGQARKRCVRMHAAQLRRIERIALDCRKKVAQLGHAMCMIRSLRPPPAACRAAAGRARRRTEPRRRTAAGNRGISCRSDSPSCRL